MNDEIKASQNATFGLLVVLAVSVLVGIPLVSLDHMSTAGDGKVGWGVTSSGIRAIRLQMTEDEVTELLGQPLRRISPFYFGSPCPGSECRPVFDQSERVQLTYAEGGPFLWVYLTDGGVSEVYAKRKVFFGMDSEGVYGLSEDQTWEDDSLEYAFRK